jgi:methionine aminopeptidase
MRSWLIPEIYDLAHGAFSRPLEDGDIVNIDITVYLDGYHGDTSRTFLVGDVVSRLHRHDDRLVLTPPRMRQGATWLPRLAKPSALGLQSVDLVNPLNLSDRPSTTLQTSEDTPYQANLRATVSVKCFIVHHGYCTTVSGGCV